MHLSTPQNNASLLVCVRACSRLCSHQSSCLRRDTCHAAFSPCIAGEWSALCLQGMLRNSFWAFWIQVGEAGQSSEATKQAIRCQRTVRLRAASHRQQNQARRRNGAGLTNAKDKPNFFRNTLYWKASSLLANVGIMWTVSRPYRGLLGSIASSTMHLHFLLVLVAIQHAFRLKTKCVGLLASG